MKRYFKTIAAATLSVLAVAACQKENLGGAQDGREVDVNLTLTSPAAGITLLFRLRLTLPLTVRRRNSSYT